MAPTRPRLSIVFPAYNEAHAIRAALAQARTLVGARQLDAEIIVVDDGSQDATAQIVSECADRDPRIRLLSHSPNRGKGCAVRRGMAEARGTYRVFLDVDLATPIEEVGRVLDSLVTGADVVLASRHLPDSRIDARQSRPRQWMGAAFRWLAQRVLGLSVSDITCGLKGFRAEAARRVFGAQTVDGWAFDAEIIYLAKKWDMNVVEVPVRWRDSGCSTVRPMSAAVESLIALLRIRWNDRRGVYDRHDAERTRPEVTVPPAPSHSLHEAPRS